MFLIPFLAAGLRLEGKGGLGFASAVARSGKFCASVSAAAWRTQGMAVAKTRAVTVVCSWRKC